MSVGVGYGCQGRDLDLVCVLLYDEYENHRSQVLPRPISFADPSSRREITKQSTNRKPKQDSHHRPQHVSLLSSGSSSSSSCPNGSVGTERSCVSASDADATPIGSEEVVC